MLYLLDTPHWHTAQRSAALPQTLPGWTVAFLAAHGGWVTREHLYALLWPDAATSEAQHNLRVNLYRVRALPGGWGAQAAFVAERKRVRLQLPTDLALLRQALAAKDAAAALAGYRQPLLADMRCAGFPALQEWLEVERAALHRQWRQAALASLSRGELGPQPAGLLCQTLMAADPLDEEALGHQLRLCVEGGQVGGARLLFAQFRLRLQQELGAEPSPALQSWLAAVSANPRGASGPPGSLQAAPARDGFVGRALELGQVEAMLATASGGVSGRINGRIVTLIGPGGVGKNRLAREITRRGAGVWRDGAAWVNLSDLSDAAAALPRLAARIGLTLTAQRDPLAQIAAALATQQGLIVLDNAEHLPALPALLAQLQSAAPATTWLVTSRTPLKLAHERTYALEGLGRPEPSEPVTDAAGLADGDAAALLADLQHTIDTLAASRPPQHARHASMHASLALSWRLLSPDEQGALAARSVFRGGFTRPAGMAVAGSSGIVLARLLERSWLALLGHGRFDLHPLVAQFAASQLAQDAGLQQAAARRHADHWARCIQPGEGADVGALAGLLAQVDAGFENCRVAWSYWLAQRNAAALARWARVWSDYGSAKGRAHELAQLVATAMPVAPAGAALRLALLQAAAILRYRCGEFDAAQALARDAVDAATAAGDAPCRRAMLNTLALALKDLGRYGEAERCAQDGLQLSRAAGAERDIAQHANTVAILAKTRGDWAAAAALYVEAIAIHRRGANQRSLALCLNNLGNVHRALGDGAAAQRCFEESLRVADQHDIANTRAFALVNLAAVHQQAGNTALALSFADRARAEPAAEIAVLLAADAAATLAAIAQQAFDSAGLALRALALRARQTGLHAALLETVGCHARLLTALGRRDEAIARWLFLGEHPQLPAMQRSDIEQALRRLAPTPDELKQAQVLAGTLELEILIEAAVACAAPAPLG